MLLYNCVIKFNNNNIKDNDIQNNTIPENTIPENTIQKYYTDDDTFLLKKSDEFAIAFTLLKLFYKDKFTITTYDKIDENIKTYIETLLDQNNLYFENQPSCQDPLSNQLTTSGGKNPIVKTKEKIQITGRTRTLYIGARKKQYVKIKGIYVTVSSLKKAEKDKEKKATAKNKKSKPSTSKK